MSSDHYFSWTPASNANKRTIRAQLAGKELDITTSGGVFSPGRVDQGTAVLLKAVPPPPPSGHLLDLGCGWGPISISLALSSEATVWAVDVNERALDLVRTNADALGLDNIKAVKPADVPDDIQFATIWSNPPIRVGKDELHAMLKLWLPRLAVDADAWLVVHKNLGSDSLQRWLADSLDSQFMVSRFMTEKGFRVLRVRG